MMLHFEISLHNGKYISATQKENMLSAPNGKYSLHKTENIRYTKQKIYAVQNRKLCCTNAQKRKYTLHETENIRCTKQKMYAAQNGKYTLHKRGYGLQKTENRTLFRASVLMIAKRIGRPEEFYK